MVAVSDCLLYILPVLYLLRAYKSSVCTHPFLLQQRLFAQGIHLIASEFLTDKLSEHFTSYLTMNDFGWKMLDVQPLWHALHLCLAKPHVIVFSTCSTCDNQPKNCWFIKGTVITICVQVGVN